jgi:hypothetical protein
MRTANVPTRRQILIACDRAQQQALDQLQLCWWLRALLGQRPQLLSEPAPPAHTRATPRAANKKRPRQP